MLQKLFRRRNRLGVWKSMFSSRVADRWTLITWTFTLKKVISLWKEKVMEFLLSA